MGRCCGGKNAGKPISWPRYLTGLSVFCAYHGTVGAALHAIAVPVPSVRKIRDFHRQVCLTDLREILGREDIRVGSKAVAEPEPACEVTMGQGTGAA